MPERDREACICPALRQIDKVELGIDSYGGSEQPQHLVDKVTAEITQQASGWPGFQCRRIVEIHSRMNPPDLAETSVANDLCQRLHVGIPAAVLENAEHHALCLRSRIQFPRSFRRRREGLVGDNMKACLDCFQHQVAPCLRRRGDGDRVNDACCDHVGQAGVDRQVWKILPHGFDGRRSPSDDACQVHIFRGHHERRMEMLAACAVADKTDPHRASHPGFRCQHLISS